MTRSETYCDFRFGLCNGYTTLQVCTSLCSLYNLGNRDASIPRSPLLLDLPRVPPSVSCSRTCIPPTHPPLHSAPVLRRLPFARLLSYPPAAALTVLSSPSTPHPPCRRVNPQQLPVNGPCNNKFCRRQLRIISEATPRDALARRAPTREGVWGRASQRLPQELHRNGGPARLLHSFECSPA